MTDSDSDQSSTPMDDASAAAIDAYRKAIDEFADALKSSFADELAGADLPEGAAARIADAAKAVEAIRTEAAMTGWRSENVTDAVGFLEDLVPDPVDDDEDDEDADEDGDGDGDGEVPVRVVTILSRTDVRVDLAELRTFLAENDASAANTNLGEALYAYAHECGGHWDSLTEAPGVQPISRIVLAQEPRRPVTESDMNAGHFEPDLFELATLDDGWIRPSATCGAHFPTELTSRNGSSADQQRRRTGRPTSSAGGFAPRSWLLPCGAWRTGAGTGGRFRRSPTWRCRCSAPSWIRPMIAA